MSILTGLTGAVLAVVLIWSPGRALVDRNSGELHLLISEELSDTSALLAAYSKDNNIELVVDYASTAEIVRRISSPENEFQGKYDAVWATDDLAQTRQAAFEDRLESGTAIMSSPLVLGLRPGVAARIAPGSTDLDWRQLLSSRAQPSFSFAMLDPQTGDARSALLGIASDLAGVPEALGPRDAFRVSPQLRALHAHQVLAARTYRDLSDSFRDADQVDAILTMESEILRSNVAAATEGSDQLTVLAPRNRAALITYRLRAILPPWSGSGRDEVGRLSEFLTGTAAQAWLARETHRRPAGASVSTASAFIPLQPIAVPSFPDLLDQLTGIYRDTFHYRSRTVFVLDTSGSMRGTGLQALRRAFRSLNASIVTRRWTDAEILVIPFSSKPAPTSQIVIRSGSPAAGLADLASVVERAQAGGGTALYAALQQADQEIVERITAGQEAVTSIILVTDGKSTTGPGLSDFVRHRSRLEQSRCTSRNREPCRTPVYPILIGKAEQAQMQILADATGGAVHDARRADLTRILQAVAEQY